MVTLDLAALYPNLARLLGAGGLKRLVVCAMRDILPFPQNWLFRLFKHAAVAAYPDDAAHLAFATLIDNDGAAQPVPIDPRRDVAVLQYTGGTTGTPKGAMLTHYNLVANALQCQMWFHGAAEGGERGLAVLPFFHAFAMTTSMNLSIAGGHEIVMVPRFELAGLLRTIAKKKPTIFPGVPTPFTAISNRKDIGRYDLSSIRFCISGGAPLPLEVKTSFERLTGCTLVEGYGLSEASPVAVCNPFGAINKTGSVGLAVARHHRRNRSAGRAAAPGAGGRTRRDLHPRPADHGRLLGQAGGNVANPSGRVAAHRRCRLSRQRRLSLPCRPDQGHHYRQRVQDLSAQCRGSDLSASSRRGMHRRRGSHPYRGQTVKAFVVALPGESLTEAALLAFLTDKLSPIEMPKQIEFRLSLPKTAVGKLSKQALLAEDAAGSPGAAGP